MPDTDPVAERAWEVARRMRGQVLAAGSTARVHEEDILENCRRVESLVARLRETEQERDAERQAKIAALRRADFLDDQGRNLGESMWDQSQQIVAEQAVSRTLREALEELMNSLDTILFRLVVEVYGKEPAYSLHEQDNHLWADPEVQAAIDAHRAARTALADSVRSGQTAKPPEFGAGQFLQPPPVRAMLCAVCSLPIEGHWSVTEDDKYVHHECFTDDPDEDPPRLEPYVLDPEMVCAEFPDVLVSQAVALEVALREVLDDDEAVDTVRRVLVAGWRPASPVPAVEASGRDGASE